MNTITTERPIEISGSEPNQGDLQDSSSDSGSVEILGHTSLDQLIEKKEFLRISPRQGCGSLRQRADLTGTPRKIDRYSITLVKAVFSAAWRPSTRTPCAQTGLATLERQARDLRVGLHFS
jgi:hypothetical protein